MFYRLLILSSFLFFSSLGWATTTEKLSNKLTGKLQQIHPSLAIKAITATPLADFYAVELTTGDLFYTHKDAGFLFAGNLLQLTNQGIVDLTEQEAEKKRLEVLASINAKEQIIYPAKDKTKAVVQVFTDTSCPFCTKLHTEVPRLNELGIEVRYLAFPRQGFNSQAYLDLQTAWCSSNPAATLTAIKEGKKPKATSCDNPISKHYELGRQLGVNGTPAIFLPSGKLIPGYVTAENLAKELGI